MPGERLEETPLNCPMEHVYDLVPAPLDELELLTRRLGDDARVDQSLRFPRGTLLPDGRPNLCKK